MAPLAYDLPSAHVALARWDLVDVCRLYRLPRVLLGDVLHAEEEADWRAVARGFLAATVVDTSTMDRCAIAALHLAAGRVAAAVEALAAIAGDSVDGWCHATRAAMDAAAGAR